MNSRNLIEAAVGLLEHNYASGAPFSPAFVELAVHVAGQPQFDRQGRVALIAGYALSTWPGADRDAFFVAADLPRPVRLALEAEPVAVPDPLPTVPPAEMTAEEEMAYRARAISKLAAITEGVRLSVLTPGAAKAQTYREKLQEVIAYEALIANEDTPDPADFPYLSAEVPTNGADIGEVAGLIRARHAAWTPVNAAIEGLYFAAKAQIAAAPVGDIPDILDAAQTAMASELEELG